MQRPRGKTGHHNSIVANDGYVRVDNCPDDECLGIPLFDNGNCFTRKAFVSSLAEAIWPVGMVVWMKYLGEMRQFVVLQAELGQVLREYEDGAACGMTLIANGTKLEGR